MLDRSWERGLCEIHRPRRSTHLLLAKRQFSFFRPSLNIVNVSAPMHSTEVGIRFSKMFDPDAGGDPNVCIAHKNLSEHVDTVVNVSPENVRRIVESDIVIFVMFSIGNLA